MYTHTCPMLSRWSCSSTLTHFFFSRLTAVSVTLFGTGPSSRPLVPPQSDAPLVQKVGLKSQNASGICAMRSQGPFWSHYRYRYRYR